jgi:hypothetical protein
VAVAKLSVLRAQIGTRVRLEDAPTCQIGYRARLLGSAEVARGHWPETCQLRRGSAVTIQAMGYFWVGTSKLDDWSSLANGQLGLQAVDR